MADTIICFINRYCRNMCDVQEEKDSALLKNQKEQTAQSLWWFTGRKKAENSEQKQSGCSRHTTKSYIFGKKINKATFRAIIEYTRAHLGKLCRSQQLQGTQPVLQFTQWQRSAKKQTTMGKLRQLTRKKPKPIIDRRGREGGKKKTKHTPPKPPHQTKPKSTNKPHQAVQLPKQACITTAQNIRWLYKTFRPATHRDSFYVTVHPPLELARQQIPWRKSKPFLCTLNII